MDPITTLVLIGAVFFVRAIVRSQKRKARTERYHNYLKSDDWQRKRSVVLKRDHFRCVYCGKNATQVHHKKYAKHKIGKEPIKLLVSVCAECHKKRHSGLF